MIWFQFLLVAAVVVVITLLLRSLRSEKSLALKRILALLAMAAAVVAIFVPNILTLVANMFGVGRGTDFLLYLFIIAAMMFAVAVIRAKARSDARVTRLARAVALMEARERETREHPDAPPRKHLGETRPRVGPEAAAEFDDTP